MSKIALERVYRHPRSKVWRALTDAELLGQWLMPNDFEPRVGHRFQFRTDPAPGFDGIVDCEVLELEPTSKLAFSWKGGPIDTVVTLTLTDHANGTRLHMEQTGFRGVKEWFVGRMLKLGCRKIYGRYLPGILDRMDASGELLVKELWTTPKTLSARFATKPVYVLTGKATASAAEALALSRAGLAGRAITDSKGKDETHFLDPLDHIVERGRTPAEGLLDAYHGYWNGDIDALFTDCMY